MNDILEYRDINHIILCIFIIYENIDFYILMIYCCFLLLNIYIYIYIYIV